MFFLRLLNFLRNFKLSFTGLFFLLSLVESIEKLKNEQVKNIIGNKSCFFFSISCLHVVQEEQPKKATVISKKKSAVSVSFVVFLFGLASFFQKFTTSANNILSPVKEIFDVVKAKQEGKKNIEKTNQQKTSKLLRNHLLTKRHQQWA